MKCLERDDAMKKLAAILGICLIACMVQAQSTTSNGSTSNATGNQGQSANAHKKHNPQEILEKINAALEKRQTEEQKVTSKGKSDIAADIQKIITDLNNMKTAMENKDKSAFKAANQQRKQDREALMALRKEDGQGKKHTKSSTSSQQTSTKSA